MVYLRNKQRPFAFAGIFDSWVDSRTGEVVDSYAIITTVSNTVTQQIDHHRSPVILRRDQEQVWLNSNTPLDDITAMLEPYPGELMNAYPISAEIRTPRANGMDLLQPIGQRIIPEDGTEHANKLGLYGLGEARADKADGDNEVTTGKLF